MSRNDENKWWYWGILAAIVVGDELFELFKNHPVLFGFVVAAVTLIGLAVFASRRLEARARQRASRDRWLEMHQRRAELRRWESLPDYTADDAEPALDEESWGDRLSQGWRALCRTWSSGPTIHIKAEPSRLRCPYCRDSIAPFASRRTCDDCHTVYHADCLHELQACGTLGCRSSREVVT